MSAIEVVLGRQILEGVKRFVGLLDEVTREGGMRLLLVPGALFAQAVHKGHQVVGGLASRAQSRHPQ